MGQSIASITILCGLLLVGCGDDSNPAGGHGAGGTGGIAGGGGSGATAMGGAGAEGGEGGAAACITNVVDLELTISPDDVADSQVIPVRYEGVDAYLAIDTGSPLTFVFGDPDGPEYVEHVGDVEVGCETYPVDALSLEGIGPEPFAGKEIIGIVGMDFFSSVPSEIDYPDRRVVRHLDGSVPASGLEEVAVDWTHDRIVVDAALDDEPVRLVYDAGSPHTVWVGQTGQPGDEEVLLGTADGGTFLVYEGTVSLDFAGDDDLLMPVWRAPSFPYFEDELDAVGAQGLLGATGLGFRRVVFDLGASRMWLGPRQAP